MRSVDEDDDREALDRIEAAFLIAVYIASAACMALVGWLIGRSFL